MSAMIVDSQTVTRFADNLRHRGKQPATIESYCRDAQRFLDYLGRAKLPPAQVEPETLIAYQDYLRNDLEERDNSVRRTVIGIRQFYRFLSESRTLKATPFDMVPIPSRDESLPKGLEEDDVDTLVTVALAGRPECKALRDAAIVSLLAHEGVKANELISLSWSDVLEEEGTAASLRVGGSRSRAIPLSPETHNWLKAYKTAYDGIKNPLIANPVKKRIFISFKGRDAASPLPEMTRHGLKFILYELGEKAGVPGLNTEQLRHFAVSYMLAHGRAPDEIMQRLGLRRIGNIAKHLHKERSRAGATAK